MKPPPIPPAALTTSLILVSSILLSSCGSMTEAVRDQERFLKDTTFRGPTDNWALAAIFHEIDHGERATSAEQLKPYLKDPGRIDRFDLQFERTRPNVVSVTGQKALVGLKYQAVMPPFVADKRGGHLMLDKTGRLIPMLFPNERGEIDVGDLRHPLLEGVQAKVDRLKKDIAVVTVLLGRYYIRHRSWPKDGEEVRETLRIEGFNRVDERFTKLTTKTDGTLWTATFDWASGGHTFKGNSFHLDANDIGEDASPDSPEIEEWLQAQTRE